MGKNYVKRAVVTRVKSDDKTYPEIQVSANDDTENMEVLNPYGFHSMPTVGSIVAMLSSQGNEESTVGVSYDAELRPKGLKEGEAVCGNFKEKSYFYFKEDGTVSLIVKDSEVATFTDETVTFKINVIHEGTSTFKDAATFEQDADFDADIKNQGKSIGKDHKHGGVKAGTDQSGGVA